MDCNIILEKPEFYGTTGSFYNLTKPYLEHTYLESQIGRKLNDGSFWMGKNYTWSTAKINPNNISIRVLFADDTSYNE